MVLPRLQGLIIEQKRTNRRSPILFPHCTRTLSNQYVQEGDTCNHNTRTSTVIATTVEEGTATAAEKRDGLSAKTLPALMNRPIRRTDTFSRKTSLYICGLSV